MNQKQTWTLLILLGVAFAWWLVSGLLRTEFLSAESRPNSIHLSGWEYRWGDAPTSEPERTAWLRDDSGTWIATENLVNPSGRQGESYLWLRLMLDDANSNFPEPLRDPTLYAPRVNDAFEVYLKDEMFFRAGQPDVGGLPSVIENELQLIPLPLDFDNKTLYFRIYSTATEENRFHFQEPRIGIPGGVYLGNESAHVATISQHDIGTFTLGSLFLVLSLVPLALFFANIQQRSYLLMTVFMIGAGLCVWLDTRLKDLVLPYPVVWEYMPAIALNLMLIGLLAFFEQVFGAGYKGILRRLWQFHVIYALVPPLAMVLPLAILGIGELMVLLGLSLYRLTQRNTEAGIFFVGFGMFAPFMALDGLLSLGLFPQSVFFFHSGILLMVMALSVILVRRFARVYRQLGETNLSLSRFVPMAFLHYLGRESITDVQLGDQTQTTMTILFADIRAFTSLSEQLTPEETFTFLNDYLGRVGPIIRQHHGFVDKYIGDGLMALFPRTPEDAVQAAITMQQEVARFNQERIAQGTFSIRIGVGIHTGLMMLGTVGEEKRIESTVISDAVNLASRIEGLTKEYGAGILISEATLRGIPRPGRYHCRFLDRVQVKGKQVAVSIYEIFEGDLPDDVNLKEKTKPDFEQAVQYYCQGNFSEARLYMQHVIHVHPFDKAAQVYLQRLEKPLTLNQTPMITWEETPLQLPER